MSHCCSRYFVNNPHRLTLRLKASREIAAETAAEERQALDAAAKEMGPEGIAAVALQQEELKRLQTSPTPPEALATLPRLERADINPVILRSTQRETDSNTKTKRGGGDSCVCVLVVG
ncbi:zinc metalloprotease 2, putative [Eimeria mitis]|uniref:Zinc metalloprotease 2, putative n=1 Tax=Eimeria mitis TaxID=44415 RepID=U6JXK4_9EIME|nr:zinc metalloprotease 2, putative [Eimeria mitis]CDJ29471.1 zinc metalloprotease 2, putative [Eimeria mitis]